MSASNKVFNGLYKSAFVICDDSGSMAYYDGKLVSGQRCSRLDEQYEALENIAKTVEGTSVPITVKFLNNPVVHKLNDLKNIKGANIASGGTPICSNIRNYILNLTFILEELKETKKKSLLVIITDGVPSDGDLLSAMQPLKNLPVKVVLRLITNDNSIVSYWNDIDKELNMDLDIIDDYRSESKEIHSKNPWLTYTPDFHNLRIVGAFNPAVFHDLDINCGNLIDLLDERPLTLKEIFCFSVFYIGGEMKDYPTDLTGLCSYFNKYESNIKLFSLFKNREQKIILPNKIWKYYSQIPKGYMPDFFPSYYRSLNEKTWLALNEKTLLAKNP